MAFDHGGASLTPRGELFGPRPTGDMTPIAQPSPSTTRRALTVAAVVLLVVACAGVALVAARSVAADDGPVEAAFSQLRYTAEVGTELAFSSVELRNVGDAAAVIESVTPTESPLGLDLLDVSAYDTRHDDGMPGVATLPIWDIDQEHIRTAAGTRMPARGTTSTKLMFVVRATRPGRYAISETTVRYRVGAERHELRVPAGVEVCATAVEGGRCG